MARMGRHPEQEQPATGLCPLEGVSSLLDKILEARRSTRRASRALWMLETIHEYARERLEGAARPMRQGGCTPSTSWPR